MTWSVMRTGTRDEVAKAIASDLDAWARNYNGKEEGEDVLAVRQRALALVASLLVLEDEQVNVSGYGSHTVGQGGGTVSASLHLEVKSIKRPA